MLAQLEQVSEVTEKRIQLWNRYYHNLKEIKSFELQTIPANCKHNGHLFYIKLKDIDERQKLIEYLKKNNIQSVFHYIPLHSSKAGLKYCVFNGKDIFTTKESERLLRLPMYYNLNLDNVDKICNIIINYFNENNQ